LSKIERLETEKSDLEEEKNTLAEKLSKLESEKISEKVDSPKKSPTPEKHIAESKTEEEVFNFISLDLRIVE
jgi:hypothetical protein